MTNFFAKQWANATVLVLMGLSVANADPHADAHRSPKQQEYATTLWDFMQPHMNWFSIPKGTTLPAGPPISENCDVYGNTKASRTVNTPEPGSFFVTRHYEDASKSG